jgi:hypothetical protein
MQIAGLIRKSDMVMPRINLGNTPVVLFPIRRTAPTVAIGEGVTLCAAGLRCCCLAYLREPRSVGG